MRITSRRRDIEIAGSGIGVARTKDGVVKLWAEDDIGLARGLGFAHAQDRLVQMMLVRLVGQGRLCECLVNDNDALEIDIFMREMGLSRYAKVEAVNAFGEGRSLGDAYAEGVNHWLGTNRRPIELMMVRYQPDWWTVADTILTVKLMSYVGLAQSQQDIEKFLVQAVRAGVPVERLAKLTAPHLDGLDEATVKLIAKLRYVQPLLPEALRFLGAAPTLMASNNWAVAGSRTASGNPLQCNDPHLECNRLPAVWYEAVMHTDDDYRIGATMPGVPGLVMGRTRNLSFGFTYGFMDMIDYFIEQCHGGSYRRGDSFVPLKTRTETIARKGSSPIEITVRETDLGILESNSRESNLEDGFYLSRAWSAHRAGGAASLHALALLPSITTVSEAQQAVREVVISCNWLLADRHGNIGYQQSGLLPDRSHSGLHPVPAWEEQWRWKGIVARDQLHSLLNPPEGFLATANNDLNPPNGPLVINLPMGSYRVDRIRALLSECEECTLEDMQRIQNDLYSLQAKRFMSVLQPLLPETFAGRLLAGWDCCYDRESRGATLFETVYHAILREVFGKGLLGAEVWDSTVSSTAIVADYYHLFDDALLGDDPSWFGEEGQSELFKRVLEEVLTEVKLEAISPWGRHQQIMMKNVFFDGRLPRWVGFDHGPVELPGNRATVVQGGLFNSHNRQTTFTPSWRFITDLGEDRALTALAGGPSGRRFSRWYKTDIKRWLSGTYKTLSVDVDLSE
ncbi:MAG: penicillin acylase family protein [Acidobacteria bacterium]|nr:penicillin acylase family protein [Candidatus Sulfomarinibacter kjeldsenii]